MNGITEPRDQRLHFDFYRGRFTKLPADPLTGHLAPDGFPATVIDAGYGKYRYGLVANKTAIVGVDIATDDVDCGRDVREKYPVKVSFMLAGLELFVWVSGKGGPRQLVKDIDYLCSLVGGASTAFEEFDSLVRDTFLAKPPAVLEEFLRVMNGE